MTNVPPLAPAEELLLIVRELAQLDARRGQLLHRRAWLLRVLTPPTAVSPGPHRPYATARPAAAPGSAPGAQNVLLTLGGILLAVAALAFTLVGWGQLGIAGRSAVLGLLTVAALTTPALLMRRGLVATAESVGVLALLLTVLDAYALHRVAFEDTGALGYAAVATTALALLWASYGLALPKLRAPLPAALLIAQLPPLLWASAQHPTPLTLAWALWATAALDTAVALRGTRPGASRPGTFHPIPAPLGVLAAVCAWVAGSLALLTALHLSVVASTAAAATAPSVLLLAGGVLALVASVRRPRLAAALVAGLALIAALAGPARPALPLAWVAPWYLVCALALLAATVPRAFALPRPVRRGLVLATATVGACTVLTTLPLLVPTVLWGPPSLAVDPWHGVPGSLRTALGPGLPWHTVSTAPLVLLLAAAALFVLGRRAPHPATATGTVLLSAAGVLAVPTSLDLGLVPALWLYVASTAGALYLASRTAAPPAARTATAAPAAGPLPARTALSYAALAAGIVTALAVSCLALVSRGATFAVFGALLVLSAALAVRTPAPVVRAVGAVGAVGFATGLACASAAALGLPPRHAALLVLAVPAAVAVLAVRVRSVPTEITAAVAALLAVGLAAGHPPTLSLVLGLCAVIAAGTAVRADRRRVGWAAAALFLPATWVRLAASGIAEPEAYTVPVSVLALAVGLLRRRGDPRASSWTVYGPGLAATLLPSLVAGWADPYWPRPLLLGLTALVVTLLGARYRLGAPLLLGGAVLALVALHELAPYVVQVVGALPRWLPPALAGTLLLAVGATYEQRLRDARRLRARLGLLH